MSGARKTALSLLICILAFSAFVVISFTGLFSVIEIKFYQPRILNSIEKNITEIDQAGKEYTSSLTERFANYASSPEVHSFFKKESSAQEQNKRTRLTGSLIQETEGLLGIRLIDTTGRHIHFSTFTRQGQDLKSRNERQTSYNDYAKTPGQPYSKIQFRELDVPQNESFKSTYYVVKNENSRKTESCIIYSVPMFAESGAKEGTALFYCDASGFNRYLLSKDIISLSGTGSIFADESFTAGGFVFGLSDIPLINNSVLEEKILEIWLSDSPLDVKDITAEALASSQTQNLHLFTRKTDSGAFISFVFDDRSLTMSDEAKFLFLAIIFITLFLIVFLVLNLHQDDMTVIKDRIRRFQLAFITEYIDKKDSGELKSLPEGISGRRSELTAEIKNSLGKRGRKHSKEVDKLLESSWNEILNALGVKTQTNLLGNKASIDTAELKKVLEDILGSGKLRIQAASIEGSPARAQDVSTAKPAPAVQAQKPVPEEPEEIEEIEEINEIEETAEAEEIEEIQEAEDAEEIEALDEAEEVSDAEEAEEIDEIEEAAEAEEIEEIQEAEDAEEIEALDEAEEVSDAEEAEEIDEIEETTSPALTETVDIDEFDEEPAPRESDQTVYDLAEEMTFSSPSASEETQEQDNTVVENFDIGKMDFSFLDDDGDSDSAEDDYEADTQEEPSDEKEKTEAEVDAIREKIDDNMYVNLSPVIEESEEKEENQADSLIELESEKDSNPFMFTSFAANNDNIRDLTPEQKDSIVENEDGTYEIEISDGGEDVELDSDFKKLVDSVLK